MGHKKRIAEKSWFSVREGTLMTQIKKMRKISRTRVISVLFIIFLHRLSKNIHEAYKLHGRVSIFDFLTDEKEIATEKESQSATSQAASKKVG